MTKKDEPQTTTITTNWQVHSVSLVEEKDLLDPACRIRRVVDKVVERIEQQQEAAVLAQEDPEAWAKNEATALFRELTNAAREEEDAAQRIRLMVAGVKDYLARFPGAFEEWAQRVENSIRRLPRPDAHQIAVMWRQYLDEQG